MGIFCISFDTELLWGREQEDWPNYKSRAKRTTKIIPKILRVLTKYNIPATWAIVGKLVEENPKIVVCIKKGKIHDIGSHSFSHKIFTTIDKKVASTEIAKSTSALKKFDIKPKSFIFPKNEIKHKNLLLNHGFTSYRGQDRFSQKKYFQLFQLLFLSPRVHSITAQKGICNIPGSMYFLSARGPRKYLPNNVRFRFAKRGIDKAIQLNKVFHLWTHPIDFADNTESLLAEFEEILKYASLKRNESMLKIMTMSEIAEKRV